MTILDKNAYESLSDHDREMVDEFRYALSLPTPADTHKEIARQMIERGQLTAEELHPNFFTDNHSNCNVCRKSSGVKPSNEI